MGRGFRGSILFVTVMTILLPLQTLSASSDPYPFTSKKEAARFYALSSEVRCIVCQNQTLAESEAPLAKDLRQKIYTMVHEGKSSQEINDFLVTRYGDFILLRPPLQKNTLVLWLLPFVLLFFPFIFILRLTLKR